VRGVADPGTPDRGMASGHVQDSAVDTGGRDRQIVQPTDVATPPATRDAGVATTGDVRATNVTRGADVSTSGVSRQTVGGSSSTDVNVDANVNAEVGPDARRMPSDQGTGRMGTAENEAKTKMHVTDPQSQNRLDYQRIEARDRGERFGEDAGYRDPEREMGAEENAEFSAEDREMERVRSAKSKQVAAEAAYRDPSGTATGAARVEGEERAENAVPDRVREGEATASDTSYKVKHPTETAEGHAKAKVDVEVRKKDPTQKDPTKK
jgi:hypothetical protein